MTATRDRTSAGGAGDGLALYFDDPPIDLESDGRGLNQVNARVLASLPDAAPVVVNLMRLRPGQRLDASQVAGFAFVLRSRAAGTLVRALGRVSAGLTAAAERLLVTLASPAPAMRPRYMLAPVGTDVGAIRRANIVATRLGARPLLYLVDDPIHALRAARPSGWRRSARGRAFDRALRRSALAFCITAELRDLIAREHGVRTEHLPLPFFYDAAIERRAPVDRIIYIGSVNAIYRRELDRWIDLLDGAGYFEHGELVVTGDMPARRGVRRQTFGSISALHQAIADSGAALMPVSSQESRLAFTSFPSKLLDYLAQSRLVLMSAPAGSVAYALFEEAGLELLFKEGEIDIGRALRALASNADNRPSYRRVLDDGFSRASYRGAVATAIARLETNGPRDEAVPASGAPHARTWPK